MITVLIQHRLRCEVAQLSFSTVYSTIFAFGGVPAHRHSSPPPPLSSSPQSTEDDKQWTMRVQIRLSTYSSSCCVSFLFWVSIYVWIITCTQHHNRGTVASSLLSFPLLSMIPHLLLVPSPGWKKDLIPALPVQRLPKPLQRLNPDDLWEMNFRKKTFFLSFLVPWAFSGKLCLLTQI